MKVYRGINMDIDERDAAFYAEHPDRLVLDLETHENGLGIHWVERRSMAEFFAIDHDQRPGFAEHCGIVIEAEIDESSIIDRVRDREEWLKYSEDHQIMDPDNPPPNWRLIENETTLRPGAKPMISAITIYTRDPDFDYEGGGHSWDRDEEPEPVERVVTFDPPVQAHVCEPVIGYGQEIEGNTLGW